MQRALLTPQVNLGLRYRWGGALKSSQLLAAAGGKDGLKSATQTKPNQTKPNHVLVPSQANANTVRPWDPAYQEYSGVKKMLDGLQSWLAVMASRWKVLCRHVAQNLRKNKDSVGK